MLKTLEPRGTLGCFLAPPLVAHVRVALDAAEPKQAVLVVQPDAMALRVLLGSNDFSWELESHRLWFACGDDWAGEIAALRRLREGGVAAVVAGVGR